ncbi:MFS transporter [Mycolicibacterium smegmatis]|uniref:MFS transporter n=1 Tax=Mycolicibacterium smegmatis TaxID=1772 RepID=UPI0020A590C3
MTAWRISPAGIPAPPPNPPRERARHRRRTSFLGRHGQTSRRPSSGSGRAQAQSVVALIARNLGASVGTAGAIIALVGLGAVLGDLPAGRVVARFGERRSIIVGSSIGAVGVLMCLAAPNPVVLAVGVAFTGLASAVWAWPGRAIWPRWCRCPCGHAPWRCSR